MEEWPAGHVVEGWPAGHVVEVTMFWKWPCCGSDHVLEVANLWKGGQLATKNTVCASSKSGQLATKNTVCILYICREKKTSRVILQKKDFRSLFPSRLLVTR